MKYLELQYDSYSENTRESNEDDAWDRGDTDTSWTFLGVNLTQHDSQYALPVEDDIKPGDTVYVVTAVYSTGDTFGHDAGHCMEFISYHKNSEIAYRNKKNIEAGLNKDKAYNYTIELDNGNTVSRYCPWDGYFESLDYVEVNEFIVKEL